MLLHDVEKIVYHFNMLVNVFEFRADAYVIHIVFAFFAAVFLVPWFQCIVHEPLKGSW